LPLCMVRRVTRRKAVPQRLQRSGFVHTVQPKGGLMTILLIILLILLLGGGGAYYGPRAGWGAPHYGGGLLGLVLLILLILYLTGSLGGRVVP
jgi:Protein of unknown function (DUF3309)